MAALSGSVLPQNLHAAIVASGVSSSGKKIVRLRDFSFTSLRLRVLRAGGPGTRMPAFASSSPSPVEEEDIPEPQLEQSEQGRPISQLSQADFVKEAVRRLSEGDLEEAVRKYNLEEELFAEVDYAQVNAFTDRPFGGNPAAVCYLPYFKDDRWLQTVAREFNLSETAFVVKQHQEKDDREEEENVDFDLRYFTPKVEVDLCGHATLASAHLLFAAGIVEGELIRFHTRCGVLKARKVRGYDELGADEEGDQKKGKKRPSGKGVVELDLPISTVTEASVEQVEKLTDALSLKQVLWCGATSGGDFLLELPSSLDVEAVKPQLHKLEDLPGRGGVIVTAAGRQGSGYDFVSRFFCPKAGIPEDPVTGSAHCALGEYWSCKLGKSQLEAYQASERGGRVSVRVVKESGRVYLEGGAVLVMAGVILNSLLPLDSV